MKKLKEKELFKILNIIEKLLIRTISITGWVKILIEMFGR